MFNKNFLVVALVSISPSLAVLDGNGNNAAQADVAAAQFARASRGISQSMLSASAGQQARAHHATAGCSPHKRANASTLSAATRPQTNGRIAK